MKMNLLVIKTNKIHELAKFYTLLGFNFEYHKHEQGIYHYSVEKDNIVFEIYPLPKNITEPDKTTRLGFEVENLSLLLAKINNYNIKIITKPYNTDNKNIAVIEDLDGRAIELYEKVKNQLTQPNFSKINSYLNKIPSVEVVSNGIYDNGFWWIKIKIDIENDLAWHVVQEIGHVVNYISITERLPTKFYPVSPPPYMNGGPKDFLSWIIDVEAHDFSPDLLQEWLEGRLPRPVEDTNEWIESE